MVCLSRRQVLIQGDLYTEQHSTSESRAQLAMLERRTNDIRQQLKSTIESASPDSEEIVKALTALRNVTKPDTAVVNLDELEDLTQSCLVSW